MLCTNQEVPLDSSAFVAGKELIQALERHASAVACDRERIFFRQGDEPTGVYVLYAGSVTLTMQSISGEEVLRLDAGPGSVLGLPALIGNKPYSLTAAAHEGTQAGFVSGEEFNRLMAQEPMLSLKVLEVLAAEVHTARRAIFDN